MNDLTEYLYTLPFWKSLTETEKRLIRDNAYTRIFDRNAVVCSETSADIGFMLLVDGKIRAFLKSDDGRKMPLFMLENQELCVFSASSLFVPISFRLCLTAERISRAVVINMTIVERLMNKNLAFRCFAYEILARRFSSVMESVKWVCFHGLEQRLAAFLVDEYERSGETHIRLTHDCIAQHVGSSRERVTKKLKQLSGRGLITKANRCIEIIDIEGLREAAENTSKNS